MHMLLLLDFYYKWYECIKSFKCEHHVSMEILFLESFGERISKVNMKSVDEMSFNGVCYGSWRNFVLIIYGEFITMEGD